jgi:hypothetical protein
VITPRPSGVVRSRSAISNCGSPKNSVPPPSSSATSDRRRTPTVWLETPPIPTRSSLPSFDSRSEQGAEVGEVDERKAPLVRIAEDEGEARLLGLVRAEHLREQLRAELGDRRPDRDAGPDPAEREALDRIRGGLVREPQVRHPFGGLALSRRRRASPDTSPL